MPYRWVSGLVISLLVLGAPEKGMAQPETDISYILEMIRKGNDAVKTFRAESQTTVTYMIPANKASALSETYTASVTVKGGLYRYEKRGDLVYPPGHHMYGFQKKGGIFTNDRTSSYNGKAEKEIDQVGKRGHVRSLGKARALPASHPSFLGIYPSGDKEQSETPPESDFSSPSWKYAGKDIIQDGEVVRIERPHPKSEDVRIMVWVDPIRGYRMAKRVMSSPEKPEALYQVEEFQEFVEAQGAYVPTYIRTTVAQDVNSGVETKIHTLIETRLVPEKVKVNEPIEDAVFDPPFPEGWSVYDDILGYKYVYNQPMSDKAVEEIVAAIETDSVPSAAAAGTPKAAESGTTVIAQARSSAAPAADSAVPGRRLPGMTPVLIGAVCAIGLFVIGRRMRR